MLFIREMPSSMNVIAFQFNGMHQLTIIEWIDKMCGIADGQIVFQNRNLTPRPAREEEERSNDTIAFNNYIKIITIVGDIWCSPVSSR